MEKLPRSQNSRDPYLRKDLEAELHISRGKVATGGALVGVAELAIWTELKLQKFVAELPFVPHAA